MRKYTGKHYVGEIVHHRGHECRVTDVWNVDGVNGLSIIPTGGYGFEVDLWEHQLKCKTSRELVIDCYRCSGGILREFVRLLEAHGFREGPNGYEVFCGNVRVYVAAPDEYLGFAVK